MTRPTMQANQTRTSINVASRVISAAIIAAFLLFTARANAAVVAGTYTSHGGSPLADRQLHFENRISGDIFLIRTGADGSFSADLPPGDYDLRAERGLVIKSDIAVDTSEVSIGRVSAVEKFNLLRWPFESQGIGPSLVETGAPATAHVAASSEAMPPQSAAKFWTPGAAPDNLPPPPPAPAPQP
jgi:hypothetical protein